VLLLNWESDAKSMEAVSTKSQDMRALKLVLYQVILYRSQEVPTIGTVEVELAKRSGGQTLQNKVDDQSRLSQRHDH
jgi:GTPase Era involved in 16S rRNA processing